MSQFALFEDAPRVDPLPREIAPWRQYERVTLYHGDCLQVLQKIPSQSIDAVCTDSPYGIGFMGKKWDTFTAGNVKQPERYSQPIVSDNPNLRGRLRSPALSPSQIEYDRSLKGQRAFQEWCEAWGRALMRVMKPGAFLVACGAPRSSHRMVCGLEDAGFEIRDSLAWLFGQGFPKSLNLGCRCKPQWDGDDGEECPICGGVIEQDGLGTALKPGHEPICLAQKPFTLTVEENVRVWGVGALNIERAELQGDRWPANVALDDEAAAILDAQAGIRASGANPTRRSADKLGRSVFGKFKGESVCVPARGADAGGASRFFYVAKPSRFERDLGCGALPMRTAGEMTDRKDGSAGLRSPRAGAGRTGGGRNPHPTVKPVALMQWLLWLIAPPGCVVLDPFLGSGTTGMAAVADGYQFIGIEAEPREDGGSFEYLETADARIRRTMEVMAP